ncbi:hypothetical protein [Pseudomonas sp.]|uniref:hypothetical protein n=1 Tax=Pseudomonas sp. TaxID=306 RepID=UPI0026029F25|nr:hypothetical protein [Pseudomonas sp.]
MKQYDLVSQEDEWGCGAACVASLLGITYQEAKKLVENIKGRSVNAKPYGLELHDIALALQAEGVKVIADWDSKVPLSDGTIVCIGGKSRYKDEHYLLKTPSGWMDPWYNLDPEKKVARYRKRYPRDSEFLVALIPV